MELNELHVPIQFEKQLGSNVELTAYLFTREGTLISQAPVTNNKASFENLKRADTKNIRLFVAPALKGSTKPVRSIKDIERYKPYEAVLRFDDKNQLSILPIPSKLIDIWHIRFCRVIGMVQKNFVIDGQNILKPLCKARVHICEIDKILFWIDRIPDHVILRIPDIILKPLPKIPVIPNPPDPGPFTNAAITPAAINRNTLFSAAAVNTRISSQINIGRVTPISKLTEIDPKIKEQLLSNNVSTIKSAVTANIQIFAPYFCYYPWIWPYLYRSDEIKIVYTDANGRFDTTIIYWATGDKPDLFFWVEYLIDGVWTTVYRPTIPCHTYWDYACGTEVIINVSDARVRPGCNDTITGEQVWVRGVGEVSVRNIKQDDTDLSPLQNVAFHRIGLNRQSLYQLYINDYVSPFATGLDFIVKFGDALPNTGATYFRWKAIKIKNADLSTYSGASDHVLNNVLTKPYYIEYIDGNGDAQTTTKYHTLGPVSGTDNLFFIPPSSPYNFLGETNPTADWQYADTIAAAFDSNGLDGDGLYEFTLELFDNAGNKIYHDPTLYKVPVDGDSGTSTNATPEFLSYDFIYGTWDFKMLLRIDNTKAVADIHDVKVNAGDGIHYSGTCGFIKYDDANAQQVDLSFQAYHENNFATFGFSVVKGNGSESCPGSTSGYVISSTPGYTRSGYGEFQSTPDFTPAAMLGMCTASGKAAFVETLGVYGLHNNGYHRVTDFDAGETNAFALEP